jgi:hypothetical protein
MLRKGSVKPVPLQNRDLRGETSFITMLQESLTAFVLQSSFW